MNQTDSILALADQCVKCGLCNAQCPTYQLNQDENESPRGRIALVQAILSANLQPGPASLAHLDHCLSCRRCERVCPSQVQYGDIMQRARNEVTSLKPLPRSSARLGLWLLERPSHRALLKGLLRVYQLGGLQWLARKSGILKRLKLDKAESRLPVIRGQVNYTKSEHGDKHIALFTGCTQSLFDTHAIQSAQQLLEAMGYRVSIPSQQVCCGALHQSQGLTGKSEQLLTQNAHVLSPETYEKVLYLSSGCGAFITEQKQQATHFEHFQEITGYLLQSGQLGKLAFKPLEKTVAVHLPCSQKNILRQPNSAFGLLEHIPGLKLVNLEQHGCCGAGASNMLKYPEIADQIRQPLVATIQQEQCEMVVTTNPGCQLHLQAGLDSATVIHPVSLLAQQLK